MKLYHISSFMNREGILTEGLKPFSYNNILKYENAIFFIKDEYKPLWWVNDSIIVDLYEVILPDEYISKLEVDHRCSEDSGAVVIYFDNDDVRLTNVKLIETRFNCGEEISYEEVDELARKIRKSFNNNLKSGNS